jgi:AcrR family transcriptional regulator
MSKFITGQKTKGKRKIIMDSAFELFFRKGYKNTKIIEIAESANIGKGTFYEYFKSKESLLYELLEEKFQDDEYKIKLIADSDLSGADKIKKLFQLEMECLEKYGAVSNTLVQELMPNNSSTSKEIAEIMHKMFIYKYDFINKVISDGITENEFKETDSTLASTVILGAISFFIAFKFNMMDHHIFPGAPFENIDWDNDKFFQLIFDGLL